ncbi:hypothetical protein CRYUN_Cryun02cG0068000 [Craigia yunnanensis]
MTCKQAPCELLRLMSPLNPLPPQLRYLQYVSRSNVGSKWPPSDRALTLDCIILIFIPNMDVEGGCRPIFRLYGQDPFMAADRTPKVLFSTPKKSKLVRYYKQVDCELVKIDSHCHDLGDVVLECISLYSDQERESMMFRAMFNTTFIRSNILMLNCEEIDILWNVKDQFPKDFRAEVIFSEMDVATSVISIDLPGIEEKDGLPMEAFAKVQEIFCNVDWPSSKTDVTNMLQHISVANILQENLETCSSKGMERASVLHDDKVKETPKLQASEHIIKSPTSAALEKQSAFSLKPSLDANSTRKKFEPQETQVAPQKPAQTTPSFGSSSDPSPIEGKTELQELQVTPQEPEHSKTSMEPSPEANSIRRKVETQELQVALRQPAQSTSSFKPTLDVNSIRKKIEQPEFQVALQRSAQPSIISQRVPQSSISAPVSYCNSLQGSPVPVSRYHSAPSALGVTALLHDHAVSKSEEHIHHVTLPLSSSSSSSISSPSSNTPKPLQLSLAIASSTPSPGTQSTSEAPLTTKASPILSPQVTLKATHTEHPGTTSLGRGQSSFVPPPPPLPSFSGASSAIDNCNSTPSFSSQPPSFLEVSPPPAAKNSFQSPSPPPPPPPFSSKSPPMVKSLLQSLPASPLPSSLSASFSSTVKNLFQSPCPPPPPPPPFSGISPSSTVKNSFSAPPSPSPPPSFASSATCSISSLPQLQTLEPPTAPPPPLRSRSVSDSNSKSSMPQPPPPPGLAPKGPSNNSAHVPPVPPPPASSPPSGAPLNLKGRAISRTGPKNQAHLRKSNLKPYHWLKLTRAMQGSLWAEAQKPEEASKAPEFDMSELESLFSAAAPNSDNSVRDGKSNRRASGRKSEKVQLVELRRAYNCEIMLTKVKISLPDLMSLVLALDNTALDADQVENLIKFCPTKEEIKLLKGYNGDKENLGKCAQFFLELMKVPRVESKLRVFSFKIQFCSQVSDLRNSLNIINSAAEEAS